MGRPGAVPPGRTVHILFGWFAASYTTELWQMFIFYSVFARDRAYRHFFIFDDRDPSPPGFRRRVVACWGWRIAAIPSGRRCSRPWPGVLTTEVGWRWAYRIFGVVFAVLIALPNGLLQRRPPDTMTVQNRPTRSVAAPTLAVGPGGPSRANRIQGNPRLWEYRSATPRCGRWY